MSRHTGQPVSAAGSNYSDFAGLSSSYQAASTQGTAGADEIVWTPEVCLAGYQRTDEQYWRNRGLTMPVDHCRASGLSHYTGPSYRANHAAEGQQSTLPYRILSQQRYISKRRFQEKPPILFRTTGSNYVRLVDAMNGNPTGLEGPDDAVFSDDNLKSQKQSIRLEVLGCQSLESEQEPNTLVVNGCKSFERQINVRNPANNARSITRAKLAEKLAKEIYEFMRVSTEYPDA
ncbi:hypothetical protein C8Q80DRAFT_705330 [Daedaleopsis nitida]|nr:hypothetical protein C8Q80DRAFT_705330 [Daedaleopsis nitida]